MIPEKIVYEYLAISTLWKILTIKAYHICPCLFLNFVIVLAYSVRICFNWSCKSNQDLTI